MEDLEYNTLSWIQGINNSCVVTLKLKKENYILTEDISIWSEYMGSITLNSGSLLFFFLFIISRFEIFFPNYSSLLVLYWNQKINNKNREFNIYQKYTDSTILLWILSFLVWVEILIRSSFTKTICILHVSGDASKYFISPFISV